MLDSPFIDVLIGLFFFFSIYSIVCSAVQELVASFLHLRGKNLRKGVDQLMGQELSKELYERSHLNALITDRKILPRYAPSYVDPKAAAASITRYVNALKDGQAAANDLMTKLDHLAEETGSPILKEIVSRVDGTVTGAIAQAREIEARAEEIFDETMDRISGWYARRAKFMIFLIALALAALTNADTLQLANRLWTDEALRLQMTAQAEAFAALPDSEKQEWCDANGRCLDKLEKTFPIGWDFSSQETDTSTQPGGATAAKSTESERAVWLLRLFGWLLTAVAASMGGPFWFDLLGKVTRLKGAGNVPQKKTAS